MNRQPLKRLLAKILIIIIMSHPEPLQTPRVTRRFAQALPLGLIGRTVLFQFCGALKKKVRGSSTKQGTSSLLTEEAEIRLKKAAAIREDERNLIAVGSGLWSFLLLLPLAGVTAGAVTSSSTPDIESL